MEKERKKAKEREEEEEEEEEEDIEMVENEDERVEINNKKTIGVGSIIAATFNGRQEKGTILQVCENVPAATLRYEGFPDMMNELHPIETLRAGKDICALHSVDPDNIKSGDYVFHRWGKQKVLYRASVVTCGVESLVRIRYINYNEDEGIQWLKTDKILRVIK